MTTEKILEKVQHQQPRLIYLSGKTCTGKTTFANYLVQHGYKKIELDKIVTESVVIPFGVLPGDGFRTAYRDLGPVEQTNAFIGAAKMEISKKLEEASLVVEGAIASPRILGELFSGEFKSFLFIYLHPVHADIYEQRILSRFEAGAKSDSAGLPKDFWELIQVSDLQEFKNTDKVSSGILTSIKVYAAKSMEESKKRLEGFQAAFTDIAIVEI